MNFIEKAKFIHKNKYDYSNTVYIDSKTNIEILCLKCNSYFTQTPDNHLQGKNCSHCSKNRKITLKYFIEKSNEIHSQKYDYSKVFFKNVNSKVEILCKAHGIFSQTVRKHLKGRGCPKCANQNIDTDNFIIKAKKIWADKWNYSKTNYVNSHKDVIIICKKHGDFEQKPNNHLSGNGCPKCKMSKGENKIALFLTQNKIEFEYQKKVGKNYFDFFIQKYNIYIEYDGEQHFKPIKYFGGENKFNEQIKRDKEKNDFCFKNKITLLRISYLNFKKINNILEKIFELNKKQS